MPGQAELPPASARRAAWARRVATLIAVLLALFILAWLGLPALLKWQAPPRLGAMLGRSVTIGAVGFKPWSLDVTVHDLAIAGPEGASAPTLEVKRIHADLSITSIFKWVPVIQALEVDAAALNLARTGEGRYDFDDILARLAARPPSEPGRFALYNVQVREARVQFDDRPVARVHRVDALQITLPFISNLPAEVNIKVEPRLAFRLNGAPFDSGAQATPFAVDKAGELKVTLNGLDLAPYLGYLPDALPLRVKRGQISADLRLRFAMPQGAGPSLSVQGTVAASDLAVTDAAGQPLLEGRHLQLGLRDVQPLARQAALDAVRIDGLTVHATRDAAGQINLAQLGSTPAPAPVAAVQGAGTASATPSRALAASAAATSSPNARVAAPVASGSSTAPPRPPSWRVTVDEIKLADGVLLWHDAAVKPATTYRLDGFTLDARQVRWPVDRPIDVKAGAALRAAPGTAPLAQLSLAGAITDRSAKLTVKLAGVSLGAFAPYLAQALAPAVEGRLAAEGQLEWVGGVDAPRLDVAVAHATLDAFRLRESGGRDAFAMTQLALDDAQIDFIARSATLGSLRLAGPLLTLARTADGRFNVAQWSVSSNAAAGSGPVKAEPGTPATAGAEGAARPWRVRLKDLRLDRGQIDFTDAALGPARAQALHVAIGDLRLAAKELDWQGDRLGAAPAIQLSARIGAPARGQANLAGTLDYEGRLGLQPLRVDGRLKLERFPVALFEPYFAASLPLALLRGEAGYSGSLSIRQQPDGFEVATSGDALLGDVHLATLRDAAAQRGDVDDLLSWQALTLKGLAVTMKPKTRPQVEIGSATLNEFFARLVITEEGQLNLQDAVGTPARTASAPSAAGPDAAAAPALRASNATPAAPARGLPIDLRIGPTQLGSGRVDFTDNFIRPNYSAALTELSGQLGAFDSTSRSMATLALRGRVAGTAQLEINGQINPLAKPIALDIKAKAIDLELAPLSPYAGKYAGYAIERGKLSMDVAYRIDADGKLEAKNQVILNQLTFGDRIESKDATQLPVRLALALLKDRNGVINIDLPISGSLNDPQFSVGGLIARVLVGMLTKALTAPFSFLSGGSGPDISVVEFQPGSTLLTASGASAIDKVAQALTDRPALKMTVTGAADPVSEHDALQQVALDARLRTESRRDAQRADAAPTPASGAAAAPGATLAADERRRLLEQLYKSTDLPNKPRNALGLAKALPEAEMEALLKSRIPVSAEGARDLAVQRGVAVRDALLAKGLGNERLFLAAPKLRAAGDGEAAWTPRVQLSLSTN